MKTLKEYISNNKQEQIDEAAFMTLKMPTHLFYSIYNILCDLREKKWNKLKNIEKEENIDLVGISQDFYKSSK